MSRRLRMTRGWNWILFAGGKGIIMFKSFQYLSVMAVIAAAAAGSPHPADAGNQPSRNDVLGIFGSAAYTFAGVADWDGDGHQDVVVRENATGDLWLYPGQSVRGYSGESRVKIGNGWGGYTFAGVADWDGDGHQDIVTRQDATGDLWLYPGQSVRGYSGEPRVQIGNGWSGYSFAGLADWDGDGHQDIVTRQDATRDLWLYPGQSVRGYSGEPRVQIGNGW